MRKSETFGVSMLIFPVVVFLFFLVVGDGACAIARLEMITLKICFHEASPDSNHLQQHRQ